MRWQEFGIGVVVGVVATAIVFQFVTKRYHVSSAGPSGMFQTKVDSWTGKTWQKAIGDEFWTITPDVQGTRSQLNRALNSVQDHGSATVDYGDRAGPPKSVPTDRELSPGALRAIVMNHRAYLTSIKARHRKEAALELGKIGPAASPALDRLRHLASFDEDPEVAELAAWAVAKIED